jgi:hypothetical protein
MKFVAGALVGAALLLPASEAHAFEFGTPAQAHPYQSAQNFYLELRGSAYKPNVDDEPALNGKHPFRDAFGDKPRFCFGVEFDWQLYRIPYIGTIGPGVGVSYVTMSRPALTKVTHQPSADSYSLDIYPLDVLAVLRADVFWLKYNIPFVPYAKAGLAWAPWRATNALGTSDAGGSKGKGATLGTDVALGLQFAFDVFDHGAARALDNATGINNTYIFGEYYWMNLNGLAQSNALYVGTNTWAAGLAFEF